MPNVMTALPVPPRDVSAPVQAWEEPTPIAEFWSVVEPWSPLAALGLVLVVLWISRASLARWVSHGAPRLAVAVLFVGAAAYALKPWETWSNAAMTGAAMVAVAVIYGSVLWVERLVTGAR